MNNKKYKYCLRQKKLVEIGCHDSVENEKSTKISEVIFDGNKGNILTNVGAIYKKFNEFFNDLPTELMSLGLTQDKYSKMIKIIVAIVEHSSCIGVKLSGNDDSTAAAKYILAKLEQISSLPKLKNKISKHPLFVAPKETAVGLKWKKPKMNVETNIPNHSLTNATFPYVSIKDTLNKIFSSEEMQNYYIDYNTKKKHKCVDGIYQGICCGSVCKSKNIFDDPLTLQLQLAIDDFEICCPLKSKAGIHKVTAVYFQIMNMPPEYRSKLENIYLVALCKSSDLKPDSTTFNHIANLIVNEIHDLESSGMPIGQHTVRGTIVNIACDNLGASGVFGFTESFAANFYCRHCECEKSDCQNRVEENKSKRRTIESYTKNLKRAENMKPKIDLKVTKGIKRSCKFNDLENFHVIENMPVDVMHDVNEGIVAYCIHDFFALLIEKKITSAADIQRRVRDFIYSPIHLQNKPSLINFEKHNCNQNASQLYCLIVNLPFIFFDLKEEIGEFWKPVETLLKSMQIIYSTVITEADIKSLEIRIKNHLSCVIEVFGRSLTPKHHFILHYPECIRKLGPPILLWTMRFEAKHKVFTDIARARKNFINVTKTMAVEHQERMCKHPNLLCTFQSSAKFSQFSKTMQFSKYKSIMEKALKTDLDSTRLHAFATYGGLEYRSGSLFILNGGIFNILHILSNDSKHFFICEPYKILNFDNFLHSFEIERQDAPESALIFDENSLQNIMVFNKLFMNGHFYVIADNLFIAQLMK